MFNTFDKLLLISDGYPVFYGKARESMEYFSSLRFNPEIPMNPAEFLLDLATGQVNDISVPEDFLVPRGSPDFEKAVIEVRTSSLFTCCLWSVALTDHEICFHVVLLPVSTTQIQNTAGAKRKRSESSNCKGARASSISYSS